MKILVIGGSYFLGRCFVDITKYDNEITILNRGNKPFSSSDIREIVGDRHDADSYARIKDERFDVIVDFCAYQKKDIEFTVSQFADKSFQYIFISTVDVYERGLAKILDESSPLEKRQFPGEEGAYISGKVSLEGEIVTVSKKYGIKYTVIRPAIIYGPYNYAPREGIYFFWIKNAGMIIHPKDATGEFQFAYVKDVANAISLCMGNEKAINEAFNICSDEYITYDRYKDALAKGLKLEFELAEVSLEEVYEKNLPLPFPLTMAESNWYNGEKIKGLGLKYTDITEGMKETWRNQE